MTLQAFKNDSTVYQQLTHDLKAIGDADQWENRPLYWDGQKGSIIGLLLHGVDLGQWEEKYGLPQWLALLFDVASSLYPGRKKIIATYLEALAAIPVGADVSSLGSKVLIALLQSSGSNLIQLDTVLPEECTKAISHLVSLHQRIIQGDSPSDEEFTRYRKEAIAWTDGMGEGYLNSLGMGIEAAGWNPAHSRTVVSDTFMYWHMAQVDIDQAAHPFTQEGLIPVVDERLHALYNEALEKSSDKNASIDVFALLKQNDPDLYSKVQSFRSDQDKASQQEWEIGFQQVIEALKS